MSYDKHFLESIAARDTGTYEPPAKQKRIEIEWTPGYNWWLLPTIEISLGVKEISFEWLCFAIYYRYGTPK